MSICGGINLIAEGGAGESRLATITLQRLSVGNSVPNAALPALSGGRRSADEKKRISLVEDDWWIVYPFMGASHLHRHFHRDAETILMNFNPPILHPTLKRKPRNQHLMNQRIEAIEEVIRPMLRDGLDSKQMASIIVEAYIRWTYDWRNRRKT